MASGNNWYNVDSSDMEGNYWKNYNYIYTNITEKPKENPWYYSPHYEIDGSAGSEDIRPLIHEVST